MLCLWCLNSRKIEVQRAPDAPCPVCSYTGDWDGNPIFVTVPRWDLNTEAWVSAQKAVAELLASQAGPDTDAN